MECEVPTWLPIAFVIVSFTVGAIVVWRVERHVRRVERQFEVDRARRSYRTVRLDEERPLREKTPVGGGDTHQ